jgi:hypothetical protein
LRRKPVARLSLPAPVPRHEREQHEQRRDTQRAPPAKAVGIEAQFDAPSRGLACYLPEQGYRTWKFRNLYCQLSAAYNASQAPAGYTRQVFGPRLFSAR